MDKINRIKLFIYSNIKKIIIISSLVLVFSVSTFLLLKKDNLETTALTYENILKEDIVNEVEEGNEEITYYFVDVKGYVNNPGVYSLEKGKRVVDAINIAGGLKKDANTTLLNLSMEVLDEMVIVVYSNQEITNLKTLKEEIKQEEVICKETVINDACICNNDNTTLGTGEKELNDKQEIKEEVNEKEPEKTKEIVNINTATIEELMTLSKIGEAKAMAIIEYREKNGNFEKVEDIKNVSGIGDSLFESIKEYITV